MPIKPKPAIVHPATLRRLPIESQLDALRALDARQKTRLLLEAENGAELMARLSPQEVYLLAVERGPEHLPELLGLATAEQWEGFLDLDCWQGDRFDARKSHRWLIALLQSEEEKVATILKEINFEQLVLILKAELEILTVAESEDDRDLTDPAVSRDGCFEVVYRNENSAKLFGRVLDILQSQVPEFSRYLLAAVSAETPGLIEESVYQQRVGRLQDMGIPEPFEARRIYAWLDPNRYRQHRPAKLAPGSSDSSAPGFALTLVRPKGLLSRALTAGMDENLAWEMTHLVNKVMMADRIDMGDLDQVGKTVGKVDATLNLALEWLAGQDVAAAGRFLADCYTEDLFRLGFSLTLQLQRRAAGIERTTVAPYLDPKARACLAALGGHPPLFYQGVIDGSRSGTRLFETLADLQAVDRWLGRMELQQRLFEQSLHFVLPDPAVADFSGCQPDRADEVTLVEFFLTALANKLLGRELLPLPIAEEELVGLHGMASRSGKVHPRLREETVKWLESLQPGGGSFASFCLDVWEEEFCAVSAENLDPRFIGGLIVRLTPPRQG